jgi:ABC-type transport system substrate-binding protein
MPGVVPSKYHYDLAMARQLLADAGSSFTTNIETTLGVASSDQETLQAAQAQLKAAGVDLVIRPVEQAAGRVTKNAGPMPGKPKPMMDIAVTARYPDPHAALYTQYHSSNWAPAGPNYGFYKNPQVDQLLDAGLAEPDAAKRADIYKQVQQLIIEDAPSVYFATASIQYVTRLKGAAISPTQQLNWTEVSKS